MVSAVVEASNLSISFGESAIFSNLSFQVARGKTAVIFGPSGGGKSVLLKILAGLLQPSQGSVKIDSKNIGMLFQKNALFDSLTVEENLLFPLKERLGIVGEEAGKRVAGMLRSVGLRGSDAQFPDQISGGMQKRLGIARALIVEPEVILYDEPTAGLDPITSRMIADLILGLQSERGSTLVVVTNDVHRAYQLGDEIYLLAQGELFHAGNSEQTRNSTDPRVHQFVTGSKKGPLTSSFLEPL